MLPEKHILYLDILGFCELAKTPARALDLYQIINGLLVHQHHAFRCFVFSDTLLVYNIFDPKTAHDRQYCVMYLAEFAQDLLYRVIGREYYFRAILTKSEFLHQHFDNLEAFFGQALINSYRDEKTLIGCGLLMDSALLPDNRIFPTIWHCGRYHYVFLTQDIQRASEYGRGGFPFSGEILDSARLNFPMYAQLFFLKDVYLKSIHSPDPKVRAKFQATWTFYHQEFRALCDTWLSSGFDYAAIADADWEAARQGFESELKSEPFKYDANRARRPGPAAVSSEERS